MKKTLMITLILFLFNISFAQPNYFSVANQQGFYSITNKVIAIANTASLNKIIRSN